MILNNFLKSPGLYNHTTLFLIYSSKNKTSKPNLFSWMIEKHKDINYSTHLYWSLCHKYQQLRVVIIAYFIKWLNNNFFSMTSLIFILLIFNLFHVLFLLIFNLSYSCTGEWNRHGSFGQFSSNISSNQMKRSLKIIFVSAKTTRWVDYLKIWITSERK